MPLRLALLALVGCAAAEKPAPAPPSSQTAPCRSGPTNVNAKWFDALVPDIRQKVQKLQPCYNTAIAAMPDIPADICLDVFVDLNGNVSAVLARKGGAQATFENCIVDTVATWELPPGPKPQPYKFTWLVQFASR